MNVVIDYGNTAAKVGIFDKHVLVDKYMFRGETELRSFLENYSGDHIIISSVATDASLVAGWAVKFRRKFVLHHTLPLPVKNLYETPATLGVDRIAGVCGAWQLFPHQDSLVIDAGTCITYDFIDAQGNYQGGSISPGMKMRFEAMHTFTARLPLISPSENTNLTGKTTEQSMQSGVVYGLLSEIEGIVARYGEKSKELRVILCGGDARFFENKLNTAIFAVPELVLSGLNSILIYNVSR